MERVRQCKLSRESSVAAGIRKFADTPTLFAQRTQPTEEDFIIVPRVSSQTRKYIPMGFIKAGTIVTDLVQIIPNANIYEFGIIISNVHMAWMRATCMRMKSDYSYSKDVVYNNFPWPNPTDAQKAKIEKTAQAILDARALYPDSSLADLYDETAMPPELRKAHQNNDRAVMEAYGFSVRDMDESKCVAELMKMYQRLTQASPCRRVRRGALFLSLKSKIFRNHFYKRVSYVTHFKKVAVAPRKKTDYNQVRKRTSTGKDGTYETGFERKEIRRRTVRACLVSCQ